MDPELAQAIATLDETRLPAHVYDARWRLVHSTPAQITNVGAAPALGACLVSSEFTEALVAGGTLLIEDVVEYGRQLTPFVVASYGGDRDALRAVADPRYLESIDAAQPRPLPPVWTGLQEIQTRGGWRPRMRAVVVPVEGANGPVGAVEVWLPNLSGDLFTMLTLTDSGHLERLFEVARSGRRPSAILFADLEASTPLARRLSTDSYFQLVRRVMRAVDDLVVTTGGLVGRHVGDGLTAFYPAELCGGEPAAARAALDTARRLSGAVAAAAATVQGAGEVRINAGVHWGDTVHLGAVVTAARYEVTALGEEVNEAARIEACATGGRVLASKALLERLDDDAIGALGIDPNGSYETLAEVAGAPEKARRDAPTLAVRPV